MRIGIFLLLLLLVGSFGVSHAGAQDACSEGTDGKSEEELQEDLERCNEEIERWQAILDEANGRVDSIDSDVQALTAKINAAEATIRAKNIAISQLSKDINLRTERIGELEDRIDTGKQSLAQLIRKTNEIDDYALVEVVLNSKDISDFFLDVDSFYSIQRSLKEHFENIRDAKAETEVEREQLDAQKSEEVDAKYVVEQRKQTIAQSEAEKKQLLAATQQEAKSYQQILADRQAKAAQINAALFSLRGLDTDGIPFEVALAYAKKAEKYTGVRAAFILAILRQESNLGVNVGQCLLVDPETGDGKGKNTGTPFARVMKPDRDVEPFLEITKELGRPPYGTPVSCPQSVGYGGGMGPTQFIPSTWVMYADRVADAIGVDTADPWNPEHAIMATGIFVSDLGAWKGGYSAEQEAAARYYAGGYWKINGLGYASSVLSYAEQYQDDIDFLDGV
ncbi:lytic murein transglycosylase [Candidatus Kaiserbacteria bacterium]|nr:lytic murein transglycosylase [Candidatus Kaiserbacteria bacterium]